MHQSTCKEQKNFWEIYFEKMYFFAIWTLSRQTRRLAENFWHVFLNCTVHVRAKEVPEKKLDSWILIIYEIWTEKTRNILENFGWVIKTKFYVSGGKCTEQSFWEKLLKVPGFLDE